ncbi:MAG: DUF58 domain-containing protein [Lentisphaeria bacterium]
MKDGLARLFSALELRRLGGLHLHARFPVEGTMLGAHRSTQRGVSLEFSDYRAYVPGDDLRHLDWRIMARNERLFIRQYEQECNLRVHLLVDVSGSMAYAGAGRESKFRTAARLAAALAYVTVRQQDLVALTLFSDRIRGQFPLGGGGEHLRQLANRLATEEPGAATDIAGSLHQLADSIRRRALVVIISDLYDDLEKLRQALAHFRRRRHDVIVYHLLDPAEREFAFGEDTAFTDLETGEELAVDPRELRGAYCARFEQFLQETRTLCAGFDVDYVPAVGIDDLPLFLQRHLVRRG